MLLNVVHIILNRQIYLNYLHVSKQNDPEIQNEYIVHQILSDVFKKYVTWRHW